MDGVVVIGTKLETKSFDAQIVQLENKLKMLEKTADESNIPEQFRRSANETKKLNAEIEQTKNKIIELKKKKDEMNKSGFSNINNQLSGIGKTMDGIIGKVIRWGLAIFSIRSAYNLVRQSASTLSQYNKRIGADIEYIKFSLAMALQPIIEKIINLVYKLMAYVGYVLKQLFGINIFANASAKAFERQKNALSGSNKQAKQLQKTLAGFDEMNIIQKNGDVSSGGGGGGIGLPSQDLNDMMKNIKIPEWLKKLTEWLKKLKNYIVENWDWLSKLGTAIGLVFGASKIAGWVSNIGKLIGGPGTGLLGLKSVLGGIIALEVGVIAVQVSEAIKKYKELEDQYNNMAKRGKNYYTVQKKIKDVSVDNTQSAENLSTAYNDFTNQLKLSTVGIKNANKNVKELNTVESIFDQTILKNTGTYKQQSDAIKQNTKDINYNIKSVRDMKLANTLTEEQEKQWIQTLKELIPQLESERKNVVKNSDEYNMLTGTINLAKQQLKQFENGNVTAEEKVKSLGESVLDGASKIAEFNRTKLNDKEAKIKVTSDTSSAESGLMGWIRTFANKIQNVFNNINFKNLTDKISKGLSNLFPNFGLKKIKSVFGLAKGGIVNLPGKGVPVGGAITGERQQEGVIPLTDSQQMSLLGEAIGRYITVNLTNITELDGRTIARKVQEVNNNTNFLMNR